MNSDSDVAVRLLERILGPEFDGYRNYRTDWDGADDGFFGCVSLDGIIPLTRDEIAYIDALYSRWNAEIRA